MTSLRLILGPTMWAKIGHFAGMSVRSRTPVIHPVALCGYSRRFCSHFDENRRVSSPSIICKKRHFSTYSCMHHPRGSRRIIDSSVDIENAEETPSQDPELQPKSEDANRYAPETFPADMNPETIKEYMKLSSASSQPDFEPEFPSDVDLLKRQMQNRKRDQTRGSYRPKIDPRDTSVLLFPGQGSQFVGMGKEVIGISKVQEMYDVASDILGYDLLDLCLNGPKEKLDKTIHCQPAIFVASLAAVEKLKEENEMAIENCIATAGFSVGEFAALVFAGSLSFETGLEIVRERAAAMQAASEEIPSGMMTVFLRPENKTKLACHTAKLYCIKELGMDPQTVDCVVANYLYPECKVLAGNIEALDFIKKNSREFGIGRTKKLAVSGAFHSKLMTPARAALEEVLKKAEIKTPIISVHSNVDSVRYKNVQKMRRLLSRQISEPVKWEQIQHKIFERPQDTAFPKCYEVGPGRQLGAILKMTNNKAYQNYRPIGV